MKSALIPFRESATVKRDLHHADPAPARRRGTGKRIIFDRIALVKRVLYKYIFDYPIENKRDRSQRKQPRLFGLVGRRNVDFSCRSVNRNAVAASFAKLQLYLDNGEGFKILKFCRFPIDRNLGRGGIQQVFGFARNLGDKYQLL